MNTANRVRPVALFLGAGYSAKAIAKALQGKGYDTFGTTRTGAGAERLKDIGIVPFIIQSFASSDLQDVFQTANIIISSVPPNKFSDESHFYDPVLRELNDLTPSAKWIAYLSATSVYGDRQGRWAFEGEAATPQLKRGFARAQAELEWLETSWPVHIFRLAGIYGKGRAPFDKLKAGKARAVIKTGHVVNRIHIDDIVSAILASIERPNPQAIYNIADGNPAPPQDVLDYAAHLIGVSKPQRVTVDHESVSAMARTFYNETKRIDISLARRELNWSPKYPEYKSGLEAILKA